MNAILVTAPTIYPVSLTELADHLFMDGNTAAEAHALNTCLAAGSHAITTGYTHYGTGISVIGKKAIVYHQPTNNGTGGTVDTKIQESDDNINYTDWTGGAFPQVTEANDTTGQEIEYAGTKQYIRTASKVLGAACDFGTLILTIDAAGAEAISLTNTLYTAIKHIEDHTGRKLLTQTWDYFLQEWPDKNFIKLPFGNLQNGTGVEPVVSWKDTDGTETTLTVDVDYSVGTKGDQCGCIFLPYGQSWPSGTLYPDDPIKIRFTCGWTAAADVPADLKTAIMFHAEYLQQHGGRADELGRIVNGYISNSKLWDEF